MSQRLKPNTSITTSKKRCFKGMYIFNEEDLQKFLPPKSSANPNPGNYTQLSNNTNFYNSCNEPTINQHGTQGNPISKSDQQKTDIRTYGNYQKSSSCQKNLSLEEKVKINHLFNLNHKVKQKSQLINKISCETDRTHNKRSTGSTSYITTNTNNIKNSTKFFNKIADDQFNIVDQGIERGHSKNICENLIQWKTTKSSFSNNRNTLDELDEINQQLENITRNIKVNNRLHLETKLAQNQQYLQQQQTKQIHNIRGKDISIPKQEKTERTVKTHSLSLKRLIRIDNIKNHEKRYLNTSRSPRQKDHINFNEDDDTIKFQLNTNNNFTTNSTNRIIKILNNSNQQVTDIYQDRPKIPSRPMTISKNRTLYINDHINFNHDKTSSQKSFGGNTNNKNMDQNLKVNLNFNFINNSIEPSGNHPQEQLSKCNNFQESLIPRIYSGNNDDKRVNINNNHGYQSYKLNNKYHIDYLRKYEKTKYMGKRNNIKRILNKEDWNFESSDKRPWNKFVTLNNSRIIKQKVIDRFDQFGRISARTTDNTANNKSNNRNSGVQEKAVRKKRNSGYDNKIKETKIYVEKCDEKDGFQEAFYEKGEGVEGWKIDKFNNSSTFSDF